MKAALYVRISTLDQNEDMQLRDLRAYCEHRKWEAVEFVDRGVSGAKASRLQLDKLMTAVKRRQFDVVVVWRFDRFARSTKHLVTALEEFQALGVGFVSHQECMDTTTPSGKCMFTISAAFAEMERSIIIERVKCGMANAKSKGKSLGRPKRIFRRDTAFEMRAEGKSWREISRLLGVPVMTLVDACTERPSETHISSDAKRKGKAAAA
jgi:DNA invertase Pin-like site-specific DNA recombinase